jgi:hypothetical protein
MYVKEIGRKNVDWLQRVRIIEYLRADINTSMILRFHKKEDNFWPTELLRASKIVPTP